jgi:hypothetical protein
VPGEHRSLGVLGWHLVPVEVGVKMVEMELLVECCSCGKGRCNTRLHNQCSF